MKQSEFLSLLATQGVHVVDGAAYGVQDGYPFTIRPYPSSRLSVCITLGSVPERAAAKQLKADLRERGIRGAMTNGRLLCYPLKLKKDTTAAAVLADLKGVVETVHHAGFAAPCICAMCGQRGTDAFVLRNMPPMGYDAVHAACFDQLHREAAKQAEDTSGSYVTGALGALAGAIVGALPAFLGLVWLEIVSAGLFLLIPVGSYYGYKLCRGRMNAAAGIFAVVCSLLGLAVTILAWDVAANCAQFDLSVADAIRLTNYYTFEQFTPEYWEWLKPNAASIVVFYLLGVVCSLGIVRRTNRTELKNTEQLRATMLVRKAPQTTEASEEE